MEIGCIQFQGPFRILGSLRSLCEAVAVQRPMLTIYGHEAQGGVTNSRTPASGIAPALPCSHSWHQRCYSLCTVHFRVLPSVFSEHIQHSQS